jgi:predicted transcriptional regulator
VVTPPREMVMSTTSIKLPTTLKKRVAAAAAGRGLTSHAFMVQAIEESARAAELRRKFVAAAETARKRLVASGKGYDGDAVHAYIRNRLQGKKPGRPRAISWRG